MPTADPAIPDGLRIYAIGDIHGSMDLLKSLLQKIEEDAHNTNVPIRIIFLGDYIDRGLHSRGIIDFLIGWRDQLKEPPVFLMGNHEQIMLSVLVDRNMDLLDSWLTFGGRETLMSYGVRPLGLPDGAEKMITELVAKVPQEHIDFLSDMEYCATYGDYYFCHAGVRPGVTLDKQKKDDLIWIRQEFLGYGGPFGKMVVHGHSIRLKAEFKSNRIGIDTGAYATGRLTALGLEGTKKWIIHTG